MFDEHGELMKDRKGEPLKRRGLTPCEERQQRIEKVGTDDHPGCEKGHWKDRPDLTDGQESVLKLYDLMRASGGTMLTTAERRDEWLAYLFQRLYLVEQEIADHKRLEDRAELRALMVALRGIG